MRFFLFNCLAVFVLQYSMVFVWNIAACFNKYLTSYTRGARRDSFRFSCKVFVIFYRFKTKMEVTEKVTWYPFLYENPLVLTRAQAVSCRPLTLDIQVHSKAISCRICGRKRGIGRGFSPNTSVARCQYRYINMSYSFIHLSPTLYNIGN
jgi:hypothetical protein